MDVDVAGRIVRLGPRPDTGQRIVELRFEILDERTQRLECVEFSIVPAQGRKLQPIDSSSIRRLNATPLVNEAREVLLSKGAGGRALDSAQLQRVAEEALTRKPGQSRLGSDHWVRVTQVYTKACTDGEPPTKAVAEAFGVSYSRAAKYVTRARELGLLTKAGKGKTSGTVHWAETVMKMGSTLSADPTHTRGQATRKSERSTPKKGASDG